MNQRLTRLIIKAMTPLAYIIYGIIVVIAGPVLIISDAIIAIRSRVRTFLFGAHIKRKIKNKPL